MSFNGNVPTFSILEQSKFQRRRMMIKKKSVRSASIAWVLILLILAGGCKKKVPVQPQAPPPPPPKAAAPTVTISADPSAIEKGQSSTLTWSSTDATNVSIDQGIGDVSTSGSRSVSPSSSTTYTITAKGAGGTSQASTRITVTSPAPPPPPPAPREEALEDQFNRRVRDIYFDYDKSDIRDDSKPTLSEAADFLKQHSSVRFSIEGHCDERGSEEYNLGLGDRRANATKNYLLSLGIAADRMNTISYGKERPQCREANEECYQKNRRAHFTLTR
jgi:peptidoglycan-associated lipoprotein